MSSGTRADGHAVATNDRHYRRLRRLWASTPRNVRAPSFDAWFAREGARFRYCAVDDVHRYLCTHFGGSLPPRLRAQRRRRRRAPPGPTLRAAAAQRRAPRPAWAPRPPPATTLAAFASLGPAERASRPTWWRPSRVTAVDPPCAPAFCPGDAVVAELDDSDSDSGDDVDVPTAAAAAPTVFRDARGTVVRCGDFVRHLDTRRLYVAVTCCPTADGRALRVARTSDEDGFHDVTGGGDDDDDAPNRLALMADGVRLARAVVDGDAL